ncbi:MAG: GNAT family N-acetyltransferase [Crocinitomicaceae bacterium]|nr:GNAT family N-acetyltransferase [Crocinitomicaceae bacterium]
MDIALRLPQISDAAAILSWENNPDNWDVSDNDSPYSLEDIIRLIESFQSTERPQQLRFIIHSKDILLGAVDIFDINYENKSGAIGILIAEEEFRKQGYASKALELIEAEARKLGIHRLTALIHSDNVKSQKLFEKMGYLIDSKCKSGDQTNTIVVEKWVEKE